MTVILLRHGRSIANTSGLLAGRSEGVSLDDTGFAQAGSLVERLGDLSDVAAVIRSPLLRCAQTVAPLVAHLGVGEYVDERLAEVDYGAWTGKPIRELLKEPMWRVVQQQPSAAVFPDGESLAHVQQRAVNAIRTYDAQFSGPRRDGLWIACSHGDVIKSIIADAMGMHLDSFQRIIVEPASVTVIRYADTRPYVHTVNCVGTRPAIPQPARREATDDSAETVGNDAARDDAVVGGSIGADAPVPAPMDR